MAERPERETLTVQELRSLILQILDNPRASGLRSPRGLRDEIRATTQKTVVQGYFNKALDEEVRAGNVKRGKDRVWLTKMEKKKKRRG